MGNRQSVGWQIDEDVASDFREFVHEKKGKTRGELGRMAEKALIEYMDNDRASRLEADHEVIEDKLDTLLGALSETDGTHTHKGRVSPTTVAEKRDLIVGRLNDRDAPVMPERDVIDAIEAVAGGDDRTLRKYKSALRRSGEVYDHPSSDSSAWTTNAEQFASWALAEFNSRPDGSIRDILEPYAMDVVEYEDLLDEAAAAQGVKR